MKIITLTIITLILAAIAGAKEVKKSIPKEINFNIHVRPILSQTCFHCHGPDEKTRESGYGIHTFDGATKSLKDAPNKYGIVPGHPEKSEAILRLFTEDDEKLMPPPKSGHKLTKYQKDILKEWVKQGAKYKKHWAFIPPKKVKPDIKSSWAKNEIDLFIEAKHKEKGLRHSNPATKEVWLRRVTHSLTGMQPTAKESRNFLRDRSNTAKERVVNRLLASTRYAEHMAIEWVEAARYADTDGYQNDYEQQNWPWRDYVIKSFLENKGFDQFTIEQLAGDLLPNATHEQIIATAFNRLHRQNSEGGALAAEFLIENALDRVDTVGTIYFGLTMNCARCHDHKYDPLTQKEVFQFSSYFNNIGEKGIGRGVSSKPLRRSESLFLTKSESLLLEEQQKKIVKIDKEIKELRDKLKIKITRAMARTKRVAREPKKVGTKAKITPQLKEATKAKEAAEKKIAAKLKAKIEAKVKVEIKADFKVKGLREKRQKIVAHMGRIRKNGSRPSSVMVMKELPTITPTYRLERGQYTSPDKSEKLTRTVPKSLLGDGAAPKDRLELAKWIVSKQNPITARVIVNRIWMHHFGRGIINTPEDLGSQSPFPTHLGLIDWLAVDFRENGWNIKRLHKMIVMSSTYGQSSKVTAMQMKADADNQWLARGPRFRLSGYALRDQALHASGLLREILGGPSVKPYQPRGLWSMMAQEANIRYRNDKPPHVYRRGLYTYWKRAIGPPQPSLFDAATREGCSVSMNRTNTPLQALNLMNDPTFVEAARKSAERVMLKHKIGTPISNKQLGELYQLIVGYKAAPKKLEVLKKSYSDFENYFQEKQKDAEALLSVGYAPTDKRLNKTTLAAFATVAHMLLNTDEIITIE